MARIVFEYDPPDRFVAGTVGEPGQRTFFLQAAGGGRTTSVALEKQQVAVLAERVEALLDEVVRQSSGEAAVPAVTPADVTDTEPLASPVEEEFRVGTMAIAWDTDDEVVVIEAQELTEERGGRRRPPADRRRGRRGADAAAGAHHRSRGPGLRLPGAGRRRRRPAAVPLLRRAAGRGRARVPAGQRLPPVGSRP